MADELRGRRVAVLLAPAGTEQVEFTEPRKAVENAGASVTVVSTQTGDAHTTNSDIKPGDTFRPDTTFDQVDADDFDALVVPGGTVGADTLRASPDAVRFVHAFVAEGKPVGVICHGPWLLVEAGVVAGRTLTSYPSLRTDIRNAGGNWVDEEVVTDKGLVTSRSPNDLPAFCSKIVEEFAEGRHPAQARSA